MTLFQEFLALVAIICSLSACTNTTIERTSDATAVPAIATSTYSESSLASSSTVYFSYDNYNINSTGSEKIKSLASIVKENGLNELGIGIYEYSLMLYLFLVLQREVDLQQYEQAV